MSKGSGMRDHPEMWLGFALETAFGFIGILITIGCAPLAVSGLYCNDLTTIIAMLRRADVTTRPNCSRNMRRNSSVEWASPASLKS
jgi:hypothetical protein